MKKLLVLLFIGLVTGGIAAQSVDVSSIEIDDLDLSEADLSDAEFYFQGPLELYVTGVRYGGTSYAAILSYDGRGTATIKVPEETTTEGKPTRVDLSGIGLSLTSSGVRLSGLIINGRRYSGTLAPVSTTRFVVTSLEAGEIASESVRGLLNDIAELEQTIENRNGRIARLNRQIEELPEEETVTELRNQTRDLEDEVADLESQVGRLQSDVNEKDDRVSSLQQEVQNLESTVQNRADRISRLNQQIEELPEQQTVRTLREQTRTLEGELEDANGRISELRSTSREQVREINALQTRISNLREPWMTADDRLSTTLPAALPNGTGMIGTWQMLGNRVAQTDDDQRFAKYVIPAIQPNSDLMYTLSARGTRSGWAGYGLHFLASGWESARRYGFGRSYLLWVTRDEPVKGTTRTYVQLYRSYDDVRMEELASIAVQPPITGYITTTLYVDRSRNEISVLVNDEHVLSFVDESMIATGNGVALRALGTVEFRRLHVTAE